MMAIRRDAPVRKLEADVEAALGREDPIYGNQERRKRARNMTKAERRRAEKQAARNRVMLDLPVEVEEVLEMWAEEHSCPKSQVAAYLILAGARAVQRGDVKALRDVRRLSRSMRYEFVLSLPGLDERTQAAVEEWRKNRKDDE